MIAASMACRVHNLLGSGEMPTRPRSSRSASQQARIAGSPDRVAVAVQAHRLAQVLELLIGEFANHTLTPQPHCEVRRTLPVLRIAVVVVPLAVVQERKPREHAGFTSSLAASARP
jgi:hypothetical protein